VYILKLA